MPPTVPPAPPDEGATGPSDESTTASTTDSTTDSTIERPMGLAEVWGDVVDVGHLRWSVVIGCALGLPAFLLGRLAFEQVTTPALAETYGLLVGLAGCLLAGALCARLFAPQRDLVEEMADGAARDEAVAELLAETGDLGRAEDLGPETRRELRDLGIDDLFDPAARDTAEGRSGR